METQKNKGCPHGCNTCDNWACNSYERCNFEFEMEKE
jgi:hypothetical protein